MRYKDRANRDPTIMNAESPEAIITIEADNDAPGGICPGN